MTRHAPGAITRRAGANARAVRHQKGMSQAHVATVLGWTQSMVGRLETGHVGMSVEQLVLLAEALGVKPARLMRGVE